MENNPINNLNILFVDDEKNVLDGLKRMLFPMKKEWKMHFAESGKEALSILDQDQIDMIVTDMQMPQISGAELLQQVIEKYPRVIRIVLSGHSDQELILKSTRTAHQFISKPCKPEELINHIQRAVHLRKCLQSEELIKLVNGIKNLPAIPELYIKLEQELNSENSSIKKIGGIIAEDITMSAKMLQLVNSAFFGLPNHITDPQQAASFLGVNVIKSLVLYIKLFSNPEKSRSKYFSIEEIWKHSILVANAAQKIYLAETKNSLAAKDAYVAGMLHDIGKLIIAQIPDYDDKLGQTINNGQLALNEAEYECFNVSHAEVGAYLLGIWNLPDHLVEAVAFHHKYDSNTSVTITNTVCYANNYINKLSNNDNLISQKFMNEPYLNWNKLLDDNKN